MTKVPVEYPAMVVPNQGLLTPIALVLPIPTLLILIISLPTLIKSPPKNEDIPVKYIVLSVVYALIDKVVVTADATTGD